MSAPITTQLAKVCGTVRGLAGVFHDEANEREDRGEADYMIRFAAQELRALDLLLERLARELRGDA